jgi:hypothetical protein
VPSKPRKREPIEPHKGDKRYVRRDEKGRFDEVVDVGRKPGRPSVGERVPLGLRVTPETKQRLDAAAAHSGRSQSQEAEMRLERSFERQDLLPEVLTLAYGKRTAGLLMLIGHVIEHVASAYSISVRGWEEKRGLTNYPAWSKATGHPRPPEHWTDFAPAYDLIATAISTVLRHARPPGKDSPEDQRQLGLNVAEEAMIALTLIGAARRGGANAAEHLRNELAKTHSLDEETANAILDPESRLATIEKLLGPIVDRLIEQELALEGGRPEGSTGRAGS